jgi:hypothetical protein
MSKVLTFLQECRENHGCHCLRNMLNLVRFENSHKLGVFTSLQNDQTCKGDKINGCEIFEEILEENKENINFVFDITQYHLEEYQKNGNKYADFINKYEDEVTSVMCLQCLWHVVSNYNDIPIGDKIYCYN